MEKVSTLFLKFALVVLALPIIAICIFVVPNLGLIAAELVPDFPAIRPIVMINYYLSALIYFFALWKAFQLLQLIDRKEAFSIVSVQALKAIKLCAYGIALLHLLALPLFFVFAEIDDAPGVVGVGLVVPFASIVIAIFAAVLQKLLHEAVEMKSENDLMI